MAAAEGRSARPLPADRGRNGRIGWQQGRKRTGPAFRAGATRLISHVPNPLQGGVPIGPEHRSGRRRSGTPRGGHRRPRRSSTEVMSATTRSQARTSRTRASREGTSGLGARAAWRPRPTGRSRRPGRQGARGSTAPSGRPGRSPIRSRVGRRCADFWGHVWHAAAAGEFDNLFYSYGGFRLSAAPIGHYIPAAAAPPTTMDSRSRCHRPRRARWSRGAAGR
jgi:hypothetical protein